MADIFDVVADSTRREILRVLRERRDADAPALGECSVSEIVTSLGLSQPTVSKHLKVLRQAGLVAVREKGQHRFYHLDHAPLEDIEDWLIPFVGAETPAEASALAHEVLRAEQRAVAAAIGRAFADASYQVSTVVKDVAPVKWRSGD